MSPEDFARRMRRLKTAPSEDSFAEEKDEIAQGFQESVAFNFAVQRNPDGSQWPARKTNPPNPMLIRTGDMFQAATSPGAAGNITEMEHHAIRFGVSDGVIHYAKFHHTGTRLMAKRRFFYLRKEDLKYVRDPLHRGLFRVFVETMRS